MTTAAVNYAKVLYGMPVSRATVQETEHLFRRTRNLQSAWEVRWYHLRQNAGS